MRLIDTNMLGVGKLYTINIGVFSNFIWSMTFIIFNKCDNSIPSHYNFMYWNSFDLSQKLSKEDLVSLGCWATLFTKETKSTVLLQIPIIRVKESFRIKWKNRNFKFQIN